MRRRVDMPGMCGHPIYEGETRCSTCGRPAAISECLTSVHIFAHDFAAALIAAFPPERLAILRRR